MCLLTTTPHASCARLNLIYEIQNSSAKMCRPISQATSVCRTADAKQLHPSVPWHSADWRPLISQISNRIWNRDCGVQPPHFSSCAHACVHVHVCCNALQTSVPLPHTEIHGRAWIEQSTSIHSIALIHSFALILFNSSHVFAYRLFFGHSTRVYWSV
jgi:hypothetical protein